jgi:hypothetical protein
VSGSVDRLEDCLVRVEHISSVAVVILDHPTKARASCTATATGQRHHCSNV